VSGARWLKQTEGASLTIVALGPPALAALQAAQGKSWNVLDARFVSPLDAEAMRKAATTGRMVVVEEGTIRGGLGSAILELLAQEDLAPRVRQLGLPHRFLRHGDAPTQRAELGLDADGIRSAAEALF
jgi:1-deoxy-D-xylulose-5-phosphate synthase